LVLETICARREALFFAKSAIGFARLQNIGRGDKLPVPGATKLVSVMKLLFCRPRGKVDSTSTENERQPTSVRSAATRKQTKWAGLGARGPHGGNDHFVQEAWINDHLPDETP
jgi:hypothetical protein